MRWVLFIALLLSFVNASEGGYDNPSFTKTVTFNVTFLGVVYVDDIRVAVGAVLGVPTNGIDSKLNVTSQSGTEIDLILHADSQSDAEAHKETLEGSTFCSSLQTTYQAIDAQFTTASDCVENVLLNTERYGTTLHSMCSEGEYEVSGIDSGMPVYMDYDTSDIGIDSDNSRTYLYLQYEVPTMYFYSDQTIDSTTYDRSVAITFHDRDVTTASHGSCFTTKTSYDECLNMNATAATWTHEDKSDDTCTQILLGKIDFDFLLRAGHMDQSTIDVQNNTRMIKGVETEVWEVYFISYVETWSGFFQQNPDNGLGNLDFNSPVDEGLDWDNHLTINSERYSFYVLPFYITWPQKVTITAVDISSVGRLVVLYAVIEQQTIDINFRPGTDEEFGVMTLIIKTQTQFPFGLLGINDPTAPAIIDIYTDNNDPDIVTQAESIEWVSNDDYTDCNDTVSENEYCEQEWHVLVKPTLCDISGFYYMKFWAACFNLAECAIDINAPAETSNSYSGLLRFQITAQEFCPFVIDEIYTDGRIDKYVDTNFTETAVPGTNLFVNDWCYFEATFWTHTKKNDYGTSHSDNDDSLISFVRPYEITMAVTMAAPPFQYTVNTDNGDVTVNSQTGDQPTDYVVTLCEVDALDFPYQGQLSTHINQACDDTTGDTLMGQLATDAGSSDFTNCATLKTYLDAQSVTGYCQNMLKDLAITIGLTDPAAQATWLTNAGYTGDLEDDWVLDVCPVMCDACVDNCFHHKGWNAIHYLNFEQWETTEGTNSIDANEIAFQIRLDERTIPVDIPNTNTQITVAMKVEIFYIGNKNPVRRELKKTFDRRTLQDEEVDPIRVGRQENIVSDSFSLSRRPFEYCQLNPNVVYVGFELDVVMDTLAIPTKSNNVDHILAFRYDIATALNCAWTDVVIYEVSRCSLEDCDQIYPSRRNLQALNSMYVKYLVDVKNVNAAHSLQIHLERSETYINGFMKGKSVISMKIDHCYPDLNTKFNEHRTKSRQEEREDAAAVDHDSSTASQGLLFTFLVAFLLY